MGIGGHYFVAAANILEKHYTSPTIGLVEAPSQGYSSTTYIASFLDKTTIVLQFRPEDRLLNEDEQLAARNHLGDFVPSVRLLAKYENSLFVYEQTRIPGFAFQELRRTPGYEKALPGIGEELGKLLGKCCIPGTRCKDDKPFMDLILGQLELLADTSDPLLLHLKGDFGAMLADVRSGTLDDFPLALSNGDMSPSNLMVSQEGVVTGLVDWEDMLKQPLGADAFAVHFVKGNGLGDNYSLSPNSVDVEERFWKAFMESIPRTVLKQIPQLLLAMKIGVVLRWTSCGTCGMPAHAPRLRAELDYPGKWLVSCDRRNE